MDNTTTVVNIGTNQSNNFEQSDLSLSWSLSPLLRGWMRMLGIEPQRKTFRWFWYFQRWIFFFVPTAVHLYTASLEHKPTSTKSLLSLFNVVNWIVRAIAVHLFLVTSFSSNWNMFEKFIEEAAYLLALENKIYHRFRKLSGIAILFIIIIVINDH